MSKRQAKASLDRPDTVAKSIPIYQQAVLRLNASRDTFGNAPAGAVSDWVQATELILSNYLRAENWTAESHARESLPPGIAKLFLDLLRFLKAGTLPVPFSSLRRRGRPGIGPVEDRDIAVAVAYIKAAHAKLLDDRSPLATISNSYGVQLRSVKRWCSEYKWLEPEALFTGSRPRDLGARLVAAMTESSARYRVAGRSATANREKSNKRKRERSTQ